MLALRPGNSHCAVDLELVNLASREIKLEEDIIITETNSG
jgi:hypothetical protein